jgi:Predicted choline kinase involved in LPS biosynthesis
VNKIGFFQSDAASQLESLKGVPEPEMNTLRTALMALYPGSSLEIEPNFSGTLSSFLVLQTGARRIVVKSHLDDPTSLRDAIKGAILFENLYSHNIECGFLWLKDVGIGGKLYHLLEFLDEHPPLHPLELRKQISHYFSEQIDFNVLNSSFPPDALKSVHQNYRFYFDTLIEFEVFNYLDRLLHGGAISADTHSQACLRIQTNIPFLQSLPRGLCHGDLSNKNILSKHSQAVIIDWEDAFMAPWTYDMAFWASFFDNKKHLEVCDTWLEPGEQKSFWLLYLIAVIKKSFLRYLRGDHLRDEISIDDRISFPANHPAAGN